MEPTITQCRALNVLWLSLLIFWTQGPIRDIEAKAPTKIEKRVAIKKNGNGAYKSKTSDGIGPRPSAWCGWWLRTQKGGGPEFNLARNWARRGSGISGPEVGAVVVWPHHVGIITAKAEGGKWVVKSGNDSNAVRERARSVSGAIAFRRV